LTFFIITYGGGGVGGSAIKFYKKNTGKNSVLIAWRGEIIYLGRIEGFEIS
jgi:hypothetical protein